MMTQEQEHVIAQALMRGLVKNHAEAYEAGCSALRRQLRELEEEEAAKLQVAARAEAEAIASNEFHLV
jgi:ABC-type Zn uptake system ZnuABC Zn-binding protein ZnuA